MKKIKKIVLGVVLAFSLTGVGFILGNIEDSVKVTDNSRSKERRVGKECLRLCRSRWSPYH